MNQNALKTSFFAIKSAIAELSDLMKEYKFYESKLAEGTIKPKDSDLSVFFGTAAMHATKIVESGAKGKQELSK